MDIWIVLVEDRHANVDALPYSSEAEAFSAARNEAESAARSHDNVEWDTELNEAMRRDGWVLYLPYGPEGDCVRVLKRTLNA